MSGGVTILTGEVTIFASGVTILAGGVTIPAGGNTGTHFLMSSHPPANSGSLRPQ